MPSFTRMVAKSILNFPFQSLSCLQVQPETISYFALYKIVKNFCLSTKCPVLFLLNSIMTHQVVDSGNYPFALDPIWKTRVSIGTSTLFFSLLLYQHALDLDNLDALDFKPRSLCAPIHVNQTNKTFQWSRFLSVINIKCVLHVIIIVIILLESKSILYI
jgi:hypothetical protein